MKRLGAFVLSSLISLCQAQNIDLRVKQTFTATTSPNGITPLQEDVIFMMYFYFMIIALFFISCTIFRVRLVERGQRLFDSMHPDEEELFHEALILSAYGETGDPLMLQHNSKLEEPLINSKHKSSESQPLLANETKNQRLPQQSGQIELKQLQTMKLKEPEKEEVNSDGKAKSQEILQGNDAKLLESEEEIKRAKKQKKRQIIEGTYDFEADKSLAKTNVGPGSFPFSDMKMSL